MDIACILNKGFTAFVLFSLLSYSLENISQIVVAEDSLILLKSDAKAIEEVLSVSSGELGAICKASAVCCSVGVVLYSLNDMSETLFLELLLSKDNVEVAAFLGDVGEVSLADISGVDWVSHESLVIWNWPGWGAHNSKGVVSIWVDGSKESALGERSLGDGYRFKEKVLEVVIDKDQNLPLMTCVLSLNACIFFY